MCIRDSIYPAEKNISLIASDISQSALDIVKRRVPSAKTVCCSCDDLPFENHSLDLIVSQFGIEYAGVSAFGEAVEKLAIGGRLVFLCHYQDGYIDQRNKAFLDGATLSIESEFIERASDLISASYSGIESRVRDAKNDFLKAEKLLADSLKENPEGIHQHLYLSLIHI